MQTDRIYRAPAVMFAAVVACTAVSASQWLIGGLVAWWAVCCLGWGAVNGQVASWLIVLNRSGVITVLTLGFSVLLLRLWKTRRFLSGLTSASTIDTAPRLARLAAKLGVTDPIVVLAADAPLAFCFGLLTPRICISAGLVDALTDKELKAVLLHEDHHCRRCDPLRSLVADVIATTLFFLPIAKELRDLFLTLAELEADRYAVQHVGRPPLAGALHKILTHPLAMRLPQTAGVAGLSATDARIAELLGDGKTPLRVSTRSLTVSSILIMAGCMLVQGPLF